MAKTAMRRGATLAVAALAVSMGFAACGDDGEDVAGFCEEYRSFEDEGEQLFEGILSTAEGEGFDETKQAFEDANESFAQLAEEAPDEIKDDVETVVDAFDEANRMIQEAESPEDLQAMDTEAIEGPEVEEAGERLDEWTQDNCDSGGGEK